MTNYYKVVKLNGNKLLSAMSNHLPKDFTIEYKLNEWVEAPYKSKIFVFTDLHKAKVFSELEYYLSVYACEIDGIYKGKNKLSIELTNGSTEDIGLLWKLIKNKKKYKHLTNSDSHWLVNTVWVNKVKLIGNPL